MIQQFHGKEKIVCLIHTEGSRYFTDQKRHLVCVPYSIENLHRMADELNIKRCWFHKDHYDIPKKRLDEIEKQCTIVPSKEIVRIIKNFNADVA